MPTAVPKPKAKHTHTGRPQRPGETTDWHRMTLVMPVQVHDRTLRIARHQRRSLTAQILHVLDEWLAKQSRGRPALASGALRPEE